MKSVIKVDLFQCVSLQIATLKLSGIWFFIPYSTEFLRFWINLLYRIVVGVLVFILPTGGQIISLIKLITNGAEIQAIAAVINLVLTELLTSFKLLDLSLRRHLFMKLVKQMNNEAFSSVPEPCLETVEKNIRFSRRLFITLFFSACSDIFVENDLHIPNNSFYDHLPVTNATNQGFERLWHPYNPCSMVVVHIQIRAIRLFDDLETTVRLNKTFGRRLVSSAYSTDYMIRASGNRKLAVHVIVVPALDGFKALPLKMDFIFFDVNKYFEYTYAYQVLYKPMMVLTFVTLQSLPWVFMICAIGQFDILIYKFENMKDFIKAAKSEGSFDENEAFESVFKTCLRHHCLIKRFVNTLQATFSGQFSSTLALSAGIICTTAVQILSIESPLQNIVELFWVFLYLFVFILILYIDCFLGNYITVKSGRISTAVYNCPWVNLKPELRRNIIIFISDSQRPLEIRAGMRLLPVSLETFTKVMNWTYKGFALMNQMKE